MLSNKSKVILSLCELDRDGEGSWSQPYQEAGYTVRRFDIQNADRADIRFLRRIKERVHGILAAPPCTQFAVSGNRTRAIEKNSAPSLFGAGEYLSEYDEKIAAALALVDACFRIAFVHQPVWFALENPVGTLSNYLGPARFAFNPNEYAGYLADPSPEAYTKKTLLWGYFNEPTRREVPAVLGSKMWSDFGGKSQKTKNERSKTPQGFARAFFAANP